MCIPFRMNLKMENHFRKTSTPGNVKNREKIKQIEQKLQTIAQAKINFSKDQKLSNILSRSHGVEKKCLEQLKANENNLRESREMLKDYERSVDETIQKESFALKNRNYQIAELEKKVNDMLMREIQKTKQAERRAIVSYEQKMEILNSQMAREIEKRKNYFKELDLSLSQNLPDLQHEVKSELQNSNQQLKRLEEELNNTVELLHQQMEAAQKKHEGSFDQFMRMMGEVIAQVKEQINSERESRISSKAKIIGLFEQAYAKLVPQE